MSTKTKKIISVNKVIPGNILLAFNDSDASIARNWQKLEQRFREDIRRLQSPLI